MSRLIRLFGLLAVLGAILLGAVPAQAREPVMCFPDVPGIESCISDRFLDFWWENGGLPVFGYPLTPAFQQQTPEGTFEVQYFERQRFEYHPENPRPFDVLLGRLGDEQLRRQGRDWRSEPVMPTVPPRCERFPITDRVVCPSFLTYWYDHGLESLRGHTKFGKAVHLSGLPLTQSRPERNPDGHQVETQWFERARYEYHPNNPPQHQILLGRLGAESLPGSTGTVGGISDGHDARAGTLRIASERDNSVTTVNYTMATTLRCSDGGAVPQNILDRSMLKLSATGSWTAEGRLLAQGITMLCR